MGNLIMKKIRLVAFSLAMMTLLCGCGKQSEKRQVSEHQASVFSRTHEVVQSNADRIDPPKTLEEMKASMARTIERQEEFREAYGDKAGVALIKVKILSEEEFPNTVQHTNIKCEILNVYECTGDYELQVGDTISTGNSRYVDPKTGKFYIDSWCVPMLDCYDYYAWSDVYQHNGMVFSDEEAQATYEERYPEETARWAALKGKRYLPYGVMSYIPVTDDVDEYFDLLRSYGFNVEDIYARQGLTVELVKTYYKEINRLYS